jgi:4-diphosphocytidyl-2-C-methyl-D-erythritol kinase
LFGISVVAGWDQPIAGVQHTIFAPAKLNLFLAVTGRRSDGYHDLISVAALLQLGDTLTITAEAGRGDELEFTLTCTDPAVPCDETNLVIRAARAFAHATGWTGRATFHLDKRLPMGAGMGGGSSDGVAALRGLNSLAGERLTPGALSGIAATLGSDCPLFLHDGPVIMRGRGERIEPLRESAAARLRERAVLVFKPAFGVPTPWAYQQLATAAAAGVPDTYLAAEEAEARLVAWQDDAAAAAEALLFNNLERPAFAKFTALPVLLEQLRRDFGLAPRMTGSGSACFALLPDGAPVPTITEAIRRAWGESAYIVATHFA